RIASNRVESTRENIDRVVGMDPSGTALLGATIRLDVGAGPNEVEVPNLLGLDSGQAQASLQGLGLVLSPTQRQQDVSDDAQVGRVVAQDPPAGSKLKKGTEVTITVGVPPKTVAVPDVVGTSIEQAQRNISGARLKTQVQEVDSARPRGEVLSQDPAGGTEVKPDSTVTLKVSLGNELTMPDLLGKTPNQAKTILERLGWTGSFTVLTTTVNDENEVGKILQQDVKEGSGFAPTQTITITVGEQGGSTTATSTRSFPTFPPDDGGNG
ncbi:MAG: PASTA domain-containing protein, partial [Actinomycetes bacterium]